MILNSIQKTRKQLEKKSNTNNIDLNFISQVQMKTHQ